MSSVPSVAIIIVNWNGLSVTDDCLRSLENLSYPNFKIILVDNGSTDGSVSYFQQQYPEVEMICLKTNTGFTGGNNAGMQKALNDEFDYILLLNNDTIVEDRNFMSEMITECENNSEIGMACPTIYYDEPENKVWYAGGWLSLWRGWGHYHQIPSDKEPTETGYTTGCCLLVKADAINDIGLLKEAYFLSVEDVEWSMRARKNGWKTVYLPGTSIIHKDSLSSRSKGKGTYSPTRVYYSFRNSIWFVREYATVFQKVLVWPFRISFRYFYRAFAYIVLGRWDKLRAISQGLKDGILSSESTFKD